MLADPNCKYTRRCILPILCFRVLFEEFFRSKEAVFLFCQKKAELLDLFMGRGSTNENYLLIKKQCYAFGIDHV